MIRKNTIDRLCPAAIAAAVLITVILIIGCLRYAEPEKRSKNADAALSTEYSDLIFDDSYVHTIDLQIPDVNWEYMVKFAKEEQYVLCDAVIDGEMIQNIAIRPKGNSSLSAISSVGSDRFSFKIEFDHYRSDNTYHGLDKLALNNLGQDVSCMKDYLTYHMMNEVGIAAPLSSYTELKVNGEDFGLYLAVEAIEDSFALRNYGDDAGCIYKPECFAMEKVTPSAFMDKEGAVFNTDFSVLGPGDRADVLGIAIRGPFEKSFGSDMEAAALHDLGDEPDLYQVFFDSSVFDLKNGDREALVEAIHLLNTDPDQAVDYASVIPYFIVHNFINNYDGYTGIFVHNYYLREADGKLSMIPWDYNLSCGIFTYESAVTSFLGEDSPYLTDLTVGNAMDDRTGMVNYPIDTPTFTVSTEDRPLLASVIDDETHLEEYHEMFQNFLDDFFASGRFEELYGNAKAAIASYVEAGQTFYSYERFSEAAEAVHDYCTLRAESIQRQLDGTLPSTAEGQHKDYVNLVDASDLKLASTVTFDSLVFGISSEDIIEILDAIAGNHTHDSEGFGAAIAEVTEDHGKIPALIGRVLSGSSILKRSISKAIEGPILLVLSIIVLVIARKRVRFYKRRR